MSEATPPRPRLARNARLRYDRHSGQHMLLYPEKGLALNPTAAKVAELCTGEHSTPAIVERLQREFPDAPPERVEREVHAFLAALRARGLLTEG